MNDFILVALLFGGLLLAFAAYAKLIQLLTGEDFQ